MENIVITAPHLLADARAEVADLAAQWSASKAVEVAQEVEEAVGSMRAIAGRLALGEGPAIDLLKAHACLQAQAQTLVVIGRQYAGLGGDHTPAAVRLRLDHLPPQRGDES